jgi:hypothetical protein
LRKLFFLSSLYVNRIFREKGERWTGKADGIRIDLSSLSLLISVWHLATSNHTLSLLLIYVPDCLWQNEHDILLAPYYRRYSSLATRFLRLPSSLRAEMRVSKCLKTVDGMLSIKLWLMSSTASLAKGPKRSGGRVVNQFPRIRRVTREIKLAKDSGASLDN